MRRVSLFIVGLLLMASIAAAQTVVNQVEVVTGATLWDITKACGHNGMDWPILKEANPQLPPPEMDRDWIKVLIRPKTKLTLPEGWSMQGMDTQIIKPIPPENCVSCHSKAETVKKVAADPFAMPTGKDPDMPWIFWLALAALLLVILFALNRERIASLKRRPWNFPQMVPNGLSEDPAEAFRQIQSIRPASPSPGRRIKRVEQGELQRNYGPKEIKVKMDFGDGVRRTTILQDGNRCYRVTTMEDKYEYYFQHCGNLIAERKNGKFSLPAGWEFVVMGEPYSAPAETAEATVQETAAAAPEQEGAAPTPSAPATEAPAAEEPPTATEPKPKTIEVEIKDGDGKSLVVKATGDESAMPTRVEKSDDKVVIYFPKKD